MNNILTIYFITILIAVIIGRTADNLKAFLCESNWWDHSFTISEFTIKTLNLCKVSSSFNFIIKHNLCINYDEVRYSLAKDYCTQQEENALSLFQKKTFLILIKRSFYFPFLQWSWWYCRGASDSASWWGRLPPSSMKVASSPWPFTMSFFSPSSSMFQCKYTLHHSLSEHRKIENEYTVYDKPLRLTQVHFVGSISNSI